ncbi:MAG: cobalamin-binding protein [Planctomycetota bacterium]|nr:cobalamin-binding protein [Planctomycetota bacterium]
MRILSLLPSATEIVCSLGLKDDLVGITHECDYPPGIETEKPIVIESCLGPEGKHLPPGEIDRRINETLQRGEGVYRIRPGLLEETRPELIITQGLCDVCAVPRFSVVEAVRSIKGFNPNVLSLDPTDLTGILADIRRVGEATGAIDASGDLVEKLEERVGEVAGRTRALGAAQRPGVACIEWPDPIFTGGHWVPEMVELAGGRDVLEKVGERSRRIDWQVVLDAKPEFIVVMPCGYNCAEARAQMHLLTARPGWRDLPAVKNQRVYIVEANAYFSRSGPRVVDGLEQLAQILHPGLFPCASPAWERYEG